MFWPVGLGTQNASVLSYVNGDGRKTMTAEDELSGDEILASSKVFRVAAALTADDHDRARLTSLVVAGPYYWASTSPKTAAIRARSV